MGRIHPPPKEVVHELPDGTIVRGELVAQEKVLESYEDAEYMRVLELVKWDDERRVLRFGYYYREKGGGDADWVWMGRAAYVRPETLRELLVKAKSNPAFEDVMESTG